MPALRAIAVSLLSVLPGAWLAFGLPLPGVTVAARTLLAIAVTPAVLLAQFFALRLLGVPFDSTVWLLLIANLPALLVVARRWRTAARKPKAAHLLLYALVWLVPLALLYPYFFRDLAAQGLRAHSFLHADIVYELANGALRIEESQLAGLAVTYPWGGHVQQAILSWTWGSSPLANYPWTNLVMLLGGVGLLAAATGRLGGELRARLVTVVLVLFAVNAVGHVLPQLLPDGFASRFPVWGDGRYTPWLRKYTLWNQHPQGHAMFAGVLFLLAGPRREVYARSTIVLAAVLTVGLAAVYPVLMPALGAVVIARILTDFVERGRGERRDLTPRDLVPLGLLAILVMAATAAALAVFEADRAGGSGLAISDPWSLKVKLAAAAIALSPLILGIVLPLAGDRGRRPPRWSTLVLGGLASAGAYVALTLVEGVEYKFVFPAAMCLAPLAAICLDRALAGRGAARAAAYAALLLFLVGAGVHRLVTNLYPLDDVPLRIEVDTFATRLAEGHELAPSLNAIADATPRGTIVVLDSVDVHVPTFARRSLYAPPRTEAVLIGVGQPVRHLLVNNRAYGTDVVDRRRAVTTRLFAPDTPPTGRIAALQEILALGRPVAILIDEARHARLAATLQSSNHGAPLFRDDRWLIWLVDERPSRALLP